ncbi:TonB-dependent receptor [Paracoccus aminophilus]|uniref:TonB-dependent receptor n=1 Tax=Paracoccus aminophilus TaxID=34003 RepID=UPI00041EB40D|nr:TonB-dependent receptor [Paracoccus aminophilus]
MAENEMISNGYSARPRSGITAALMMSTLILAGAVVVPVGMAAAQDGQTTGTAVNFSIPAGPLGPALMVWGRQAGVQISYLDAATSGKTTAGLSASLAPERALARLLSGSGLRYRFSDPRSVTISGVVPGAASSGTAPDGAIMLDTVVIRSSADAPYVTAGSVSEISAEQIERVPSATVADVFKSTPGVISAGSRVGPSVDVNIRGLQGQGRVNVMIDGTRQTGGSYRGYRGSRSETYVDADFLTGVDVAKGPGTGAGGIGAMGGTINMRTITADDILSEGATKGFRLRSGLGSDTKSPQATGTKTIRDGQPGFDGSSWSGSLAYAVRHENFDFLAGFSRRKTGNYFAGKTGQDMYDLSLRSPWQSGPWKMSPFGKEQEVFNTSQDITSFLTKASWYFGDHSLKLGYTHYRNSYGELNETTLGFALSPTINIPAQQDALSKTVTNTVTLKYDYAPSGNDLVHLSANLWVSDLKSTSGVIKSQMMGATGKSEVRTFGGDVSNRSDIATPIGALSMVNGAEFVLERSRSDQLVNEYPWGTFLYSFNPNADRTLSGVFHRSTLEVNDWLSLSGGMRYDHYKIVGKGNVAGKGDQSGSHFSKNFGVTLTPATGLQLFATYAEGWRPPSLREQGSFGAGGLVINPDLKPETSRSVELGVNYLRDSLWRDGDALRLKFVAFDGKYQDYIIRNRNANWEYTWGNIDRARFKGAEISANYDAGLAFVEASATHYDKIEFCNNGVCGAGAAATDYGVITVPPRFTGTLTGGVRLLEDRSLTLGGRAYIFSERFGGYMTAPGAVNGPIYYTKNKIIDLFGSYRLNEAMVLDVSVENLTNKYYLDPMATAIAPSPGRTARINLTARF